MVGHFRISENDVELDELSLTNVLNKRCPVAFNANDVHEMLKLLLGEVNGSQ